MQFSTTNLTKPGPQTLATFARLLEDRGYKADIAKENFDKAVKAIGYMFANKCGLFLFGDNGTGKSTFLKALSKLTFGPTPLYPEPVRFKYIDLKDPYTVQLLDRQDPDNIFGDLLHYNVIIDDLGAEYPKPEWGVRREVVADFIYAFTAMSENSITISTNLGGDKLVDRYNTRLDMVKDHCLPLVFTGKTLRQWTLFDQPEGGAR